MIRKYYNNCPMAQLLLSLSFHRSFIPLQISHKFCSKINPIGSLMGIDGVFVCKRHNRVKNGGLYNKGNAHEKYRYIPAKHIILITTSS